MSRGRRTASSASISWRRSRSWPTATSAAPSCSATTWTASRSTWPRRSCRVGRASPPGWAATSTSTPGRSGSTRTARRRREPAALGATRRAALLDSLRRTIDSLSWNPGGTEWADYDRQTSYSDEGTQAKEALVEGMLRDAGGAVVWDLGANVGRFSAIAAGLGRRVVAWDVDPAASERHYQRLKADGASAVLPLVQDLVNPSPGLGWAGSERPVLDRSDADVVLGLALVHHLAISNNVPLGWIADLFARLAAAAIVEFVPKDDPMTRRLLAARRDVSPRLHAGGLRAGVRGALPDRRPGVDPGFRSNPLRLVRR